MEVAPATTLRHTIMVVDTNLPMMTAVDINHLTTTATIDPQRGSTNKAISDVIPTLLALCDADNFLLDTLTMFSMVNARVAILSAIARQTGFSQFLHETPGSNLFGPSSDRLNADFLSAITL